MKIRGFVRGFFVTFPLIFVVSAIVSYLHSLLVHGSGILDWDSCIRFALIFGIVLPAVGLFEKTSTKWGL